MRRDRRRRRARASCLRVRCLSRCAAFVAAGAAGAPARATGCVVPDDRVPQGSALVPAAQAVSPASAPLGPGGEGVMVERRGRVRALGGSKWGEDRKWITVGGVMR